MEWWPANTLGDALFPIQTAPVFRTSSSLYLEHHPHCMWPNRWTPFILKPKMAVCSSSPDLIHSFCSQWISFVIVWFGLKSSKWTTPFITYQTHSNTFSSLGCQCFFFPYSLSSVHDIFYRESIPHPHDVKKQFIHEM